MKKIIIIGMLASLICFSVSVSAQEELQKGASQTAQEHASDNAIFNRIPDWFATRGKSEEEKQAILAERKAARAQKRAEAQAKKAQRNTEREMKKAEKGLEEAGQKQQKRMGEVNKGAEGLMKKQGKGKNR